MLAESKELRYDGKTFEYIQVSFSNDDAVLVEELKERALQLSNVVRPEDLGGWHRDDYTKYCRCLVGVIAESAFRLCVMKFSGSSNIRFNHLQIGSSLEQIDVRVVVGERPVEVEVRSSCSYKTSFERVFTGAFSIIGWYRTSTKRSEKIKDYYVQVVFLFDSAEIEKQLEQGLVLYFAAGASRKLLEAIGEWSDLDQPGAEFRIIKPIVKGQEPRKLILEMTMGR